MHTKPPLPPDRTATPRHKTRKAQTDSPISEPKKTLRDLIREVPNSDDFAAIAKDVESASDRSAAIVVASVVDRFLEQAILEQLVRNDKDTVKSLVATGGALSEFFGKIHLGYAMGLYNSQKRTELDAIRHIRNAFAHSAKDITFATRQIDKECRTVKPLKKFGGMLDNRLTYMSACNRITN
jgi:hypothetical protein